MLITKKLTIDFVNRSLRRSIYAVQRDSNTRAVEVTLMADGIPWEPPEGTAVSVAFRKPDGNKGWYDQLPDGTNACTVAGNVVTAILAPEVLTAPGRVNAAIVFQDADLNQISTFGFVIEVEPNPAAGKVISNSYYKYSTMEAVNAAVEALEKLIADLDLDAVLYTEQTLTDAQKAQARENIGAADDAAVREKIADVNAKIGDYIDFDFVDGAYINYKGNTVTHSDYSYTSFAPNNAKTLWITAFLQGSAAIAFMNGNVVLSYYTHSGTYGEVVELAIPEHCTEVRVSCLASDKEQFCVKAQLFEVIKNAEKNHISKCIDITPTTWTEGKYLNSTGKEVTLDGYYISDYIPVFPFTSVTGMYAIQAAARWVLYDVNKKVIKAYSNSDGSAASQKAMQTVDTTGAHYIRFSCNGTYIGSFRAYCTYDPAILETLPERLAAELPYLKPNDRPLPVEDMPENGGYMAIFDKIGVVGDSLSSGEMSYGTSTGTTRFVDMYHYSWLQFIARMCGSTGINFSKGGMSTTSFLANSGGMLDKLTAEGNKCKCYFIALAHNDRNNSKTIGTADDIDLADYNNNADSYYGNYAGIIQRIKEVEPNAIIFPITAKLNQFENEGWNTAIRYMGEIFDNVYVLDMYRYYKDFPAWHDTEGHGNIMGYLWYAKQVACYVDWIVRNNPEKFKYIQFIGTEYAEYIPETIA